MIIITYEYHLISLFSEKQLFAYHRLFHITEYRKRES